MSRFRGLRIYADPSMSRKETEWFQAFLGESLPDINAICKLEDGSIETEIEQACQEETAKRRYDKAKQGNHEVTDSCYIFDAEFKPYCEEEHYGTKMGQS